MLNVYPSSIPSTPRLPLMLRRRRGGQPFNRNALNHGLYAVKNRTLLTEISSTLSTRSLILDAGSQSVSRQLILDLMEEIGLAYQKLRTVEDNRSVIAWFNILVRMVALVGRMKVDFIKRFLIGSDLQYVSQHALALIRNSFWEKGIVSEPDSFRANVVKSDFNSWTVEEAFCPSVSRAPLPFLTPRQWAVLKPLVPPAERTGKRGRPPADPRILLDAIFWKLAHHARWQDLTPGYPPMLTCRRYYRRLFLAGRLDSLFTALFDDFLARGKVSLYVLVERESVALSENQVILCRGLDKFWQMRTALLFFQQGYQALLRQRREKAYPHRARLQTARAVARDKEIQARSSREAEEFSFTPIDLAHLGSDPENEDEPAQIVRNRTSRPPMYIDRGNYSFTPIDLGNLGSDDNEEEDEPPEARRKQPSLSHPRMEADRRSFSPLDLDHLDEYTANKGVPGNSPIIKPAPLLIPLGEQDPVSIIPYSPVVPNTQSHSGELTP